MSRMRALCLGEISLLNLSKACVCYRAELVHFDTFMRAAWVSFHLTCHWFRSVLSESFQYFFNARNTIRIAFTLLQHAYCICIYNASQVAIPVDLISSNIITKQVSIFIVYIYKCGCVPVCIRFLRHTLGTIDAFVSDRSLNLISRRPWKTLHKLNIPELWQSQNVFDMPVYI